MDVLYGRTDLVVDELIRDLKLLLMWLEDSRRGDPNAKWQIHGVMMYRAASVPEPGDGIEEFRAQQEAHFLRQLEARAEADFAKGGEDSAVAVMQLLHRARTDRGLRRQLVTLLQLIGYTPFKFKEVIEGGLAPQELQGGGDKKKKTRSQRK
ncbi:hypothetical protein KBA73_05570 [Patescibacteria group bacterium]|jgi:hypothetical protein|nr:hypothetical protein [Patescibacteria group bacterium]